jgi:tight adherence protein B
VTSLYPVAATVGGAAIGIGLLILYCALSRTAPADFLPPTWPDRLRTLLRPDDRPRPLRRLFLALGTGVLVFVLTGWPVAGPIAAWGAWSLPAYVGPDREGARRIARIEALAAWTEQLRDTISAASGLVQALRATAALAPKSIRPQVSALASRLEEQQPLPEALRVFADELSDPLADLVVVALITASRRQSGQLAGLLASLAETAREEARMHIRVSASRARARTSMRIIVGLTLSMWGGLFIFDRSYISPFDSMSGQVVVVWISGLFAAGFAFAAWLTRLACAPRILGPAGPGGAIPASASSGAVAL